MHFYIIWSLFVFRRKCVGIDNVALIIFFFFSFCSCVSPVPGMLCQSVLVGLLFSTLLVCENEFNSLKSSRGGRVIYHQCNFALAHWFADGPFNPG